MPLEDDNDPDAALCGDFDEKDANEDEADFSLREEPSQRNILSKTYLTG